MIDTDAYDRLRTEILHGDLAPGERLRVADVPGLVRFYHHLMQAAGE